MKESSDVDSYIAGFPEEIREKLYQMRETIRRAAPDAEEVISYRMPAYRFHGMLLYFAGFSRHIGFYPTSSGIEAFKEELSAYKWSKGTVQFPFDKPLPLDLIDRMVRFRLTENLAKADFF